MRLQVGMQRRATNTRCVLLFVFGFVSPVNGQPLPDGAEDWNLETTDGVDLYVVEFGAAAVPGDTVVVLHGDGAQSKAIYGPRSKRLLTGTTSFFTISEDLSGRLLPTAPFLSNASCPISKTSGAHSVKNGSRSSPTRWVHVSLIPNHAIEIVVRG